MEATSTPQVSTSQPTPPAPASRPWYRDPVQRAVAVVVALVVVGLGVWLAISSNERKEQFAARSLNQARAAAEAGNLPLASSELQRLIDTYRGTDAATEAVITLNQVRMVNGQNELAAVSLREFLATNPDAKYRAPAQGLLGAALENARRWPEAAEAYRNAAEAADVDYLKAQYLVAAARAYREGGKPADAVQTLRTVVEKYPESGVITEAKVRLAELTDGKM